MALLVDRFRGGLRGLNGEDGREGHPTDPGEVAHGRAREATPERLLDAAGAIPWEANSRTGQFTQVGKRAVELLGYPLGLWCEPTFWVQRIHPDDRESAVPRYREALAAERDTAFEYRMRTADGRVVWLRHVVTAEPAYARCGRARGVLSDVTQHREVEARLQEQKQLAVLETASEPPEISFDTLARRAGVEVVEIARRP